MKSVYGLILLSLLAAPASADNEAVKIPIHAPYFVTAGTLLAMCSSSAKDSNGPDVCKFYIAAVIDTVISNRNVIQGYHICWPSQPLDPETLSDSMVKYMRAHPEYADGVAASVVDSMLFDTYRCPGTEAPERPEAPPPQP